MGAVLEREYVEMVSVDQAALSLSSQTTQWHPLSAIQRSLWFLYRMRPDLRGHYHAVFTARIEPHIDPEVLSRALNHVAAQHTMLRTRFATGTEAASQN